MAILIGDVSSNNARPIPFAALKKAGLTGLYIKCTEGTGYVNPFYGSDFQEAKKAGLIVGSYHFGHAHQDGTAQANHFIRHAFAYIEGDLPTAYDCEVTDGQGLEAIAGQAIEFHRAMAGAHIPDTLYSGQSFMSTYLKDTRLPSSRWVASYGVAMPPPVPVGRNDLWQYTDAAIIGGYSLDCSAWQGTAASFDNWRHHNYPAPTPPTAGAYKPTPTTAAWPWPHPFIRLANHNEVWGHRLTNGHVDARTHEPKANYPGDQAYWHARGYVNDAQVLIDNAHNAAQIAALPEVPYHPLG